MTHPRNQDGFALVEVIVSAAVLAIVALAVLSGIDGANLSSARERARATAAALAEQDQERMRSYRFDKLAVIPQQGLREIDGVNYTVKSDAQWITDDANATPKCGDKSVKQAEYLRITTTVTSGLVGGRIAPVKIESMVAPSVTYAQDHGTLAVKVVAGTLQRAAGINVTIIPKDGGATLQLPTNAEGCALFRSIDVGDYTVRLNTVGYLDKGRNQTSELGATVSPNFVNVVSMPYDKAVQMQIGVTTLKPGTAMSTTATRFASKANAVSDNASNSASGVLQTFTAPSNAYFTSLKTPNVFPFEAAYQFFTGDCAYQSPVKTGNTSYFTDAATKGASVLGDPDVFQPQAVTAFQPAFNIRVRADYNTPNPSPAATFDAAAAGVTVWATLQRGTDTCNDITGQQLALRDWPGTTPVDWGTAPVPGKNWVAQNATGFDPGMPFGNYTICLQDGTKYWKSPTYDNTKPSGQPTTVEWPPVGATWTNTSCVNG